MNKHKLKYQFIKPLLEKNPLYNLLSFYRIPGHN